MMIHVRGPWFSRPRRPTGRRDHRATRLGEFDRKKLSTCARAAPTRRQGEASIANVNRPRGTPSPARVDSRRTREPARVRKQSPPVSRILFSALAGAATIIPLGPASLPGSCHLPAASPSRITGRLFGVAPRRDCPFHPTRLRLVGHVACAPHPQQFHSSAALPIETLEARCARPQPVDSSLLL